jgi:hypothetical protein
LKKIKEGMGTIQGELIIYSEILENAFIATEQ